jgi:hypothetical protein
MYIITARRMISGEVLKYLNGLRITRSYETDASRSNPSSSDGVDGPDQRHRDVPC